MSREEYLEVAHSVAKRGASLPHAKLTDELVRRIRAEHKPFSRTHGVPALARHYGLHRRTVEKVLSYESWAHVS